MGQEFSQIVEKLYKQYVARKRWQKVVTFFSAIVVFCTTYALILPAITLETTCGYEEHIHEEACYEEGNLEGVLICMEEEHTHVEACYPKEGSEETKETETASEDTVAETVTEESEQTEVLEEVPDVTEEEPRESEEEETPVTEEGEEPADEEEAEVQEEPEIEEEIEPETQEPTEEETVEELETQEDVTEEITEEPAEETEEEGVNPYEGLMSIEELKQLGDDTAGATTEWYEPVAVFSLRRSIQDWSFDAYYVNQDELYHVEKSDDFNLKYQVEFHTSRDLEAESVVIRIPATLFVDRYGKEMLPTDIGVPQAEVQVNGSIKYTEVRDTPFNYYFETDEEGNQYIVFINYKKITSGTNTAFQVLYNNQQIMSIIDQTEWELPVNISVTYNQTAEDSTVTPVTETGDRTLTGHVDSQVVLSGVQKTAYKEIGKLYTPGLYTIAQLQKYLGRDLTEAEKTAFENGEYVYVLWQVDIRGDATQPWNILLTDTPTAGDAAGVVLGVSVQSDAKYVPAEQNEEGYYVVAQNVAERKIEQKAYVVTAFPAANVTEGVIVKNETEVTLQPVDKVDPEQKQSDSVEWAYVHYTWEYKNTDEGKEDNIIEISKKGLDGTLKKDELDRSGWMDIYEYNKARSKDVGDLSFVVESVSGGYALGHSTEDETLGELTGEYYTVVTADDVLYAHVTTEIEDNASTEEYELSSEDYYFSGVTVKVTDKGYDPYEDTEAAAETVPETVPGAGNAEIYLMYAGSASWELAHTIPWDDSGVLSYTLSDTELAKEPWRVKVVHSTINHRTVCEIQVDVMIRDTSPVMEKILANENVVSLQLENLGGTYGEWFDATGETKEAIIAQFDDALGDNYTNRDNLKQLTVDLHDNKVLMRENAFASLTALEKNAQANKYVSQYNDAQTGRVKLSYTLTAYEGYNVYSQSIINNLINAGCAQPDRTEVVFYDLLPYGVHFDPAQEITVGKLQGVSPEMQTKTANWSADQVTVSVDTTKDIIKNYNNTGRMLVKFHVKYEGADPTACADGMWFNGWGVQFGAYYIWKDIELAETGVNIVAFMPEADDASDLFGEEDQVFADDGTLPESIYAKEFENFGSDIDGDNNTSEKNVLYAYSVVSENDIAMSSNSGITKLVKADSDVFGEFEETTAVTAGGGYSYEITVQNVQDELKDIVIYDCLEMAWEHRSDEEAEKFQDVRASWKGTFAGVDISSLEQRGVEAQVYYNANTYEDEADWKAAIGITGSDSLSYANPDDVLIAANGWVAAENWTADLSTVKAIAVDIRKTNTDQDFSLLGQQSVSFEVKMISPEKTENGAVYAYNNASYYSTAVHSQDELDDTSAVVIGNSVKIKLNMPGILVVEKSFEGEVPEKWVDYDFQFTVSNRSLGQTLDYYVYELWEMSEDGSWSQIDGVYATDEEGLLYLKANQKAIFRKIEDIKNVTVKELDNPFWEASQEEIAADDTVGATDQIVKKYHLTNKYRSVVYFQKLFGFDTRDYAQENGDTFTFQILVNDEPLANSTFWYVYSIRTDGGVPGKKAEGMTDENGCFTLKRGDKIALFPGQIGDSYRITEVAGYGEGTDWVCVEPSKVNEVQAEGTSESITNYYKWKSLYVRKLIQNQDAEECTQEFTFQIFKKVWSEDGSYTEVPVTTQNKWYFEDEEPAESQTLDENGCFTAACAGKTVVVEGLEAGTTYVIKETQWGEDYIPLNEGIAEVTMPMKSLVMSAQITNRYIRGDLEVSKTVIFNTESEDALNEVNTKEFTMILSLDGEPAANIPYTIMVNGAEEGTGTTDANGRFTLKNGETAQFKAVALLDTSYAVTEVQDADYPQLYPVGSASAEDSTEEVLGTPLEGKITSETSYADIINGNSNCLMIKKVLTAGEGGETYVNYNDAFPQPVQFKLSVNGEVWSGGSCSVIDEKTGEVTTEDIAVDTEGYFDVYPFHVLVVTNVSKEDSYVLSEKNTTSFYQLYDESWVEISQKVPANNKDITGTVEQKPMASVVNEVTGLAGTKIYKEMKTGSSDVPEGARLVWKVERYEAGKWVPAADIPYVLGDDTGITSKTVLTTGEDGLIELKKTDNGYPYILFKEDVVQINLSEGMEEGDLRIVEKLENSDSEWGALYAYTDGILYGTDISSTADAEEAGFVNTNLSTNPVEIEKVLESGNTDREFTFILEQVLLYSKEDSGYSLQETIPGVGITYEIYDAATDEKTGSGTTDSEGKFTIKAGQYVRLNIPDGTTWTVREMADYQYELKDLGTEQIENGHQLTMLSDNLMMIHPEKSNAGGFLKAVAKEKWVTADQVLTEDDFEVYYVDEDYNVTLLDSTQYNVPEAIPADGLVTITGTGDYAEYSTTAQLTILGEITLTKAHVTAGVVDAETGIIYRYEDGDELYIPDIMLDENGKPCVVVGIGEEAFYKYQRTLTGDTVVPNTVRTIGKFAFAYCTVDSIVFEDTQEQPSQLEVIDMAAFGWCSNITTITIPANVKELRTGTFKTGSTNQSDGSWVGPFYACENLTSVIIEDTEEEPSQLKKIEATTFFSCEKLARINLPSGITEIEYGAFFNCKALSSIELPSGLTKLGGGTFRSTGLTSITIPASVTTMSAEDFAECSSLVSVVFEDTEENPSQLQTVGTMMFGGCTNLTSVSLPSSLTAIGTYAFYGCSKLVSITIPQGVTTIKTRAFYSCSSLTTITIPSSVTTIESDAFYGCSKLTEIIVEKEEGSISGANWGAPGATVTWTGTAATE